MFNPLKAFGGWKRKRETEELDRLLGIVRVIPVYGSDEPIGIRLLSIHAFAGRRGVMAYLKANRGK